jgi:hypothetical protein
MLSSESGRTFDAMKDELLRSFAGQFALVCGRRLMGVYATADDAIGAASRLFDSGDIPAGSAILISEIADRASLRVLATPYRRAPARDGQAPLP